MMPDQEREAHREEIIKAARRVTQNGSPGIFGVQNPHIKDLRDEIDALDEYDRRHPSP